MDQALENWDSIRKLGVRSASHEASLMSQGAGGCSYTMNAVKSGRRAYATSPAGNTKLVVLISDGITTDW